MHLYLSLNLGITVMMERYFKTRDNGSNDLHQRFISRERAQVMEGQDCHWPHLYSEGFPRILNGSLCPYY
jgi:hypothetical protein